MFGVLVWFSVGCFCSFFFPPGLFPSLLNILTLNFPTYTSLKSELYPTGFTSDWSLSLSRSPKEVLTMSEPEQPTVKTLSAQPSLLKGTPITTLTLFFIGFFCICPVRIQPDPLCHQSYQHSWNNLKRKQRTA